jgi:tetratricopeptide (TPR) repeat protein
VTSNRVARSGRPFALAAAVVLVGWVGSARAQVAPADADKVIAAANAASAAGRLADAENLLREALHDGWSPKLGAALGGVLVQRAQELDAPSELMRSLRDGMLGEALAIYQRAADDETTRVDAAIGSAACHVVAGRIDAADGVLAAALKQLREGHGPLEQRRRLVQERVRVLAESGQKPAAQAQIDESQAAGDLDEAASRYEELVIASYSKSAPTISAAALAAVKAGADAFDVAFLCYDAIGDTQFEALLHLYSKLLDARPREPALLFYRGFVRMWMGDAPGAIEDFKPCLDDPKLGERVQLQYGSALIRVSRAEESLPIFEKLAQPGSPLLGEALKGIESVAVSRARARKFADALVLYREVLARNPTSLYARIGEPLCLRNLGDYENAAAAYEAGIAALPDEAQLLNDYALMLKAHGEGAHALELFERALGAGSADAGENLGIIAYREKHDVDLAARYFARTITILNDGKQRPRPRVLFYRELCLAETAAREAK